VHESGLLADWGIRLLRQERQSVLCCPAWWGPLGDRSCGLLAILTLNPDRDCKIGITGAARQPVAFCRAAINLRIGSEELNHGRKRIAISTKAFADAAAVQRLPGSSNKVPADMIGHQERSGLAMPSVHAHQCSNRGCCA
jgi:hypothetical protein